MVLVGSKRVGYSFDTIDYWAGEIVKRVSLVFRSFFGGKEEMEEKLDKLIWEGGKERESNEPGAVVFSIGDGTVKSRVA